MSENDNQKPFNFLRDSTLLITLLTAVAYFCGSVDFRLLEYYIGLNKIHITRDSSLILLLGGCNLVLNVITFYLLMAFMGIIKNRKITLEIFLFRLPQSRDSVISFLLRFAIYCSCMVFILSWSTSKYYIKIAPRVQEIVLSSEQHFSNISELRYIGHSHSFIVLERLDGEQKGDIILIAESDIRFIRLK